MEEWNRCIDDGYTIVSWTPVILRENNTWRHLVSGILVKFEKEQL